MVRFSHDGSCLASTSAQTDAASGYFLFVFEFVHYIADVYKGSKPTKSFMEFAAFASFFPSQIAGPIKRYQDFNDRLRAPEAWSTSLFYEAMTLIVQGLFKEGSNR